MVTFQPSPGSRSASRHSRHRCRVRRVYARWTTTALARALVLVWLVPTCDAAWAARDQPWPPEVFLDQVVAVETALRIVTVLDDPDTRREPSPRLLSPAERRVFDIALESGRAPLALDDECDDEAFATRTGDALVEHIRSTPRHCISRLFSQASTRFDAFRKQNIIDVARTTRPLAVAYDGTNSNNIAELFLFLRAGFYVWYYEGDELDWTLPDDEVTNAVAGALDAFTDNTHFYDETEEHVQDVLREGVAFMDSSELQARYLAETKSWLRLWRPALLDVAGLDRALNRFLVLLYRGHFQETFVDATADDIELVEILRDFALDDWMLDTDAEYLAANAGRELARFSQYGDASIYPAARDAIKAILERYDMDGEGEQIWIATAAGAVFYDDCEVYGICGFEAEMEASVLAIRHGCGDTVTIRAQNLEPYDLDKACALLDAQQAYFHRRLRTGDTPVPDDLNSSLEVVVFADSTDYGTYSTVFFGNDTNNGGIYLEGDPSDPGNTARIIAYVATWLDDRPVWNLEHEHVHYLDGRFNLHGSFRDYQVATHHTVWWAEGLAEYISMRNDNPTAVDIGRTGDVKLSEVFPVVYGDGSTMVYRWSYLAVRFMFERHRDVVDTLLGYVRTGDYDAYRTHLIEEVGTAYDSRWAAWLRDVPATGDATPDLAELPRRLALEEGSASTYGIALAAEPTGDVEIDIAVEGVDLAVEPTSMTFSPAGWATSKIVRVTAPEDDNVVHDTATLLHTASGGGYDTVRALVAVAVADNAPTISFVDASVPVKEGGTAVLGVMIGRALESATTFGYRVGPDRDAATHDADAADHDATDGEATIPAGETTAPIEIRVRDDEEIEPAREILAVSLDPSTVTGFALRGIRATVIIEEGVCDRTPGVREVLRNGRPCEAVTDTNLADEHFLQLGGRLQGTLRTGDFRGLTGVSDLRLYDNRLRVLPPGLFSDMGSLTWLLLYSNELVELLPGAFDGAVSLERLELAHNDLPELPVNLFRGIGGLTRLELRANPGAPFTLTLDWYRLGARTVVATVRTGAPFDMGADVSAVGGTLSEDKVVVPAGAIASQLIMVTPDGTNPVRVAFDTVPAVPEDDCFGYPCFDGLATATGPSLEIADDVEPADLPPSYVVPAGVAGRITLADLFPGIVGDTVGYRVSCSDPSLLGVRIDKGELVLSPRAAGAAVVSVTATEAGETSIVHFLVTIAEPVRTSLPYFPSASDASGRQGFLRVVNRNGGRGAVGIDVVDDDGAPAGSLTLSVGPGEAVHINSEDMEHGNGPKGLFGGAESDQGAWRLGLASVPGIEILSFIRTSDGLLASMHDVAPSAENVRRVAIFNPGSNTAQASLLRLANPSAEAATATIRGTDDKGEPGGEVSATIPAHGSLTVSAHDLESGAAYGLSGALGDGAGKWRLDIESALPVQVMSLLSSPTGHLTNLSTAPSNRLDAAHSVPLFPSASDPSGRSGFVRLVNHSDVEGEVTIHAFDEAGGEYGPVRLTVAPLETVHFNSNDLESGNPEKGLAGSTGSGEGDWRLEVSSEANIEVLSYIRTTDGFLTSMHDLVPKGARDHRIHIFNPGKNTNQVSRLRLINVGAEAAEVTVAGIDDAGASSPSARATVPAGTVKSFTAAELETGTSDLEGALGTGVGKWQLTVESVPPIMVMSLLESPTGHLTNLSTAPPSPRQSSVSMDD